MRRASRFLALAAAATALAGCPGPKPERAKPTPSARPAAAGDRLNVLLITIDTLRADHLGAYGYRRPTSPRMDALARRGAVFEQAYTYWPKTRGSFVGIMTGRFASQTGYSKSHPLLLGCNPTLASVLKDAGYETVATVDNPNVASSLGYAKGFDRYRETWEEKVARHGDGPHARDHRGRGPLPRPGEARPAVPALAALREPARALRAARALRHGVPRRRGVARPGACARWTAFTAGSRGRGAVPGKDRLGWYVAQYDGEIAAVDAEVGKLLEALDGSAVRDRTLVVITSDHGESLGEHDYYFDHGENLFDPAMRIPLLVAGPGVTPGRRTRRPRHDARPRPHRPRRGQGLLPAGPRGGEPAAGRAWRAAPGPPAPPGPERPQPAGRVGPALQDRGDALGRRAPATRCTTARPTPGRPATRRERTPERAREERRELELFRERIDAWMVKTRRLLEGQSGEERLSAEACEKLKAMGYVQQGCS